MVTHNQKASLQKGMSYHKWGCVVKIVTVTCGDPPCSDGKRHHSEAGGTLPRGLVSTLACSASFLRARCERERERQVAIVVVADAGTPPPPLAQL